MVDGDGDGAVVVVVVADEDIRPFLETLDDGRVVMTKEYAEAVSKDGDQGRRDG